jgi:hypothetical protein
VVSHSLKDRVDPLLVGVDRVHVGSARHEVAGAVADRQVVIAALAVEAVLTLPPGEGVGLAITGQLIHHRTLRRCGFRRRTLGTRCVADGVTQAIRAHGCVCEHVAADPRLHACRTQPRHRPGFSSSSHSCTRRTLRVPPTKSSERYLKLKALQALKRSRCPRGQQCRVRRDPPSGQGGLRWPHPPPAVVSLTIAFALESPSSPATASATFRIRRLAGSALPPAAQSSHGDVS